MYSTDDPANPQNWSRSKKALFLLQLCAYTICVYGASRMYVLGEAGLMKEFGVRNTPAALGLAIYALGYGIGLLLRAFSARSLRWAETGLYSHLSHFCRPVDSDGACRQLCGPSYLAIPDGDLWEPVFGEWRRFSGGYDESLPAASKNLTD
jgi:hypothetical protein